MKLIYKIAVGVAAAALLSWGIIYFISRKERSFSASQSIPASFSVNSVGAMNWSMDIAVPPGIQNIQPQLSIDYTSQNVSGLLGVGFDLKGLSEITRTGATLAQDGFNGGISYAPTDRFQLDGNRLMLMQGSAYGAANSVYHTQSESWTKVVAVGQSGGGPQSFQIWTKKGMYFEYGSTADSRVAALSAAATPAYPDGSIRQWLVNKCRDLHGNTLTASYTQAPPDSTGAALTACAGQGQSYPLRIDYTANDSVVALRSVQFVYELRPDSSTCFIGGSKFSTRARMTAIRTFVKDAGGDSVLVREVRIRYETNTPLGVSRIAELGVQGSDCGYAATSFDWSEGQDTLIPKGISWGGNGTNAGFVGDFNGDGMNDILQSNNQMNLGTASGFENVGNVGNVYSASLYNFVGDYNGDGLSDFLAASSGGGTIYYYDPQNHAFNNSKAFSGMMISSGCYPDKCVWQGDFNGDGLSDICSAIGTTVYVNFGNATTGLAPYKSQSGLQVYAGNTYTADFNGDGLTDIFSCNPSTGYLTLSNWSQSPTAGFQASITIPNMNFTISDTEAYTWIGDFNGDGLADILAEGQDTFRVYYATGSGFQPGKIVSINLNTTAVWPADFNHDGEMDFYAASDNSGVIYLSNGLDFSAQEPINYTFQPQYTWLGDFNGDGLTDLFNCYQWQMYYGGNAGAANQAVNQQANLITGIDNGIGSTISITYKPITDGSVYTPGNSTATVAIDGQRAINAYNAVPLSSVQNQLNGTISIQQAMFVVSDWTVTDGRGAVYSYQQLYSGAKYDMTGYGFLGYAQIKSADLNQGSVQQTFYLQGFPFSGMTDSTATLDTNGNIYQSTAYVWDSVSMKSATPVPVYQVLQQAQSTYLFYQQKVACQSLQQNWYDSYGNVQKSANTGNVATPATLWSFTTYDNDTANWQLGYVTSARQTSDSGGNQWLSAVRVGYNAERSVDSLYTWFSSSNTWLNRSFGYDAFGNQLVQTSYAGDTTRTTYDSIYHSFPVRSYSPPNAQGVVLHTQSIYEPLYGRSVQTTDPNGNVFRYAYDGLGRFRQAWLPDSTGQQTMVIAQNFLPSDTGFIMQLTGRHDWAGSLIDTSYLYYDGLNRNYRSQDIGWNNQAVYRQQTFNSAGQVLSATLPYFAGAAQVWISSVYDPVGRTIQSVIPFENTDSIITRIQYQGLTTQVVRAAGTPDSTISKYTTAYYNNKSCIVNFINADGIPTTYAWDLLGRIRSATDTKGNQMASSWNSLNMNDWFYSASFDTTFFHYQPIQQTGYTVNAINDTTHTLFDNLGRLLSLQARGGYPTTFQYDVSSVKNGLGNLCQVVQDNGATKYAFSYDALGNPTTEQAQLDGKAWQQTSVYNPDFSRASQRFPNAIQAQWNYNRTGQPLSVSQIVAGQPAKAVVTVDNADADGNWLHYTYGNGVTTQKSFYADGTLQNMEVAGPSTDAYWSKAYTWNRQGLIATINDLVDAAQSESYTYGPTGRLIQVQTSAKKDSMAYDQAGNLIWNDSISFTYSGYQVKSGTYRSKNVYLAQYNAAGQQYSRTVQGEGPARAYAYHYDGYGQMDSVYRNDTLVQVYTYDYLGTRNRVKDVLKGTIHYHVFDSYSEMVSGSGVRASCNFDLGGAVMASFSSADSVEYYSSNQNSSTVLVTGAQGNVLQRLSYTPFGKFRQTGSDSTYAQYKFNGKEFDEGSGLYYFNSRYYDPFTCRFNSPDDQLGGGLTTPDALNNYAFVNNSPVTLSDPSGHQPEGAKAALEVVELTVLATLEVGADAASGGTIAPLEGALDEVIFVDLKATEMIDLTTTEDFTTVSNTVENQVLKSPATSTGDTDKPSKMTGKRKRGGKETDLPDSKKPATRVSPRTAKPIYDLKTIMEDEISEEDVSEGGDFVIDKRRPSYSSRQRDKVWRTAAKASPNGRVFCPGKGCGVRLYNTKTYLCGRRFIIDWQMGHRPGYEFRYLYEIKDQIGEEAYLGEYRNPNHYQPECPKCNLSHANESNKSLYKIQEIKRNYSTSYNDAPGRLPFYLPGCRRRDIRGQEKEQAFYRMAS